MVGFDVLNRTAILMIAMNWYYHSDNKKSSGWIFSQSLQRHHNGRDGISNHQPHDCLLNRLFGRRSKKTSKLRVTGLRAGNSPVTGEFPAQMANCAENVFIWWRHHGPHLAKTSGFLPSSNKAKDNMLAVVSCPATKKVTKLSMATSMASASSVCDSAIIRSTSYNLEEMFKCNDSHVAVTFTLL